MKCKKTLYAASVCCDCTISRCGAYGSISLTKWRALLHGFTVTASSLLYLSVSAAFLYVLLCHGEKIFGLLFSLIVCSETVASSQLADDLISNLLLINLPLCNFTCYWPETDCSYYCSFYYYFLTRGGGKPLVAQKLQKKTTKLVWKWTLLWPVVINETHAAKPNWNVAPQRKSVGIKTTLLNYCYYNYYFVNLCEKHGLSEEMFLWVMGRGYY